MTALDQRNLLKNELKFDVNKVFCLFCLQYVVGKKAPVNVVTINPKCISLSELYGEFNSNTMEWKDGLLSRIFRKFSQDGNKLVASSRAHREKEESHKHTLVGKYWYFQCCVVMC